MKDFGGTWTNDKLEILINYIKAYLQIMNNRKYWKLIYFDGFAGSGIIQSNDNNQSSALEGMARRIFQMSTPRNFDMYYFVDKNSSNIDQLRNYIHNNHKEKEKIIYFDSADCNKKLLSLAKFLNLKENKNYKVLAFIDPFGMQLKWASLAALKDLPIDIWILVPTGLGVNRLLKRNGMISDSWLQRLELFLGLNKNEIIEYFYKEELVLPLFGSDKELTKEDKAIERAGALYRLQLMTIFKYVSSAFQIKNNTGSIMYHFILASNNKTAQKIANDIISSR